MLASIHHYIVCILFKNLKKQKEKDMTWEKKFFLLLSNLMVHSSRKYLERIVHPSVFFFCAFRRCCSCCCRRRCAKNDDDDDDFDEDDDDDGDDVYSLPSLWLYYI